MNKIFFTFFSLVIFAISTFGFSVKPPVQTPDKGRIDRLYIYSPQLSDTIPVDVWTPEGYDTSGANYPVLYMHDGQNLYDKATTWNHQAWNVDSIASSLADRGIINPPIIVGVHSDAPTRVSTLMPVKGVAEVNIAEGMKDHLRGLSLKGDEYVDFLVSTLKPAIDSSYRTIADREHTSVAGSSMGGLMSIYAICERPDIFGNAICLSTHWSGEPGISDQFAASLRNYIQRTLPDACDFAAKGEYVPRLYFDHGTTTIDASYGDYEPLVLKMLRLKGYDAAHLMSYVAEGAPHEENAWEARFFLPLIFVHHR